MSFILDALRKSEIERQRQSGPSIAEFPVAREDRRLPVALLAIGLLLAVNVGIVLFFLLRDARAPASGPTSAPAPVATSMTSAPPASTATPAPATSASADPAAPGEELAEPVEEFGEPATLPPAAPDPTLLPEAPLADPGVMYSEAPPAPLEQLPAQAAAGLSELTVDLHIYTDDPAKRAVFINGRRYIQGAQIAEGPVVEEITRDGAVLRYRGRRFLLPRL
ncbi:MAG: general secretion pathway protein GspB [Steroidobacteraceae bacterium]